MTIWRFVAGACSFILLLVLVLSGLAAVALGTERGNEMLRLQIADLADGLLGPQFRAELGTQTFAIDMGGALALTFDGARVIDASSGQAVAVARSVAIELEVLPLLSGRLSSGRLKVEGAVLETERLPREAEPENLPRLLDDLLASADEQLGRFDRIGTVDLIDLTLATPSGAVGLDRLSLRGAGDGSLKLDLEARWRDAPLHLSGVAALDPVSHRLRRLELAGAHRPADGAGRGDPRIDANLSIASEAEGPRRIDLTVRVGPGRIRLPEPVTDIEEAALRLSFVEGEDRVSIEAGAVSLSDAGATFAGHIQARDEESRHEVVLVADTLWSAVGVDRGARRSAAATIEATVDLESRLIEFDRLSLRPHSGDGALQGEGRLDFSGAQGRLALAMTGSDIEAADVKAFWPRVLAERARSWFLENVSATGDVVSASLDLDITLERLRLLLSPEESPTASEFALDASFRDASFRTADHLPGLQAAEGGVKVRGGRTSVALSAANIDGVEGVTLEASSADFVGEGRELTGQISVNVAGDAAGLLSFAQALPAMPDGGMGDGLAARGKARVALGLSLDLSQATPDDQRLKAWTVMAALEDVDLTTPLRGRRISQISGTIDAAPGMAVGDVRANIDGIPATVSFYLPLGPASADDRSVRIALSLSDADRNSRWPQLNGLVSGDVLAELTEEGGVLSGALDLTRARISLPLAGWTKGAGVAAELGFDLSEHSDHVALSRMSLVGNGFSATGRAVLDYQGLRSLDLDTLALNAGDDVALKVRRAPDGFSARLQGASLDARPLLETLKKGLTGPGAAGGDTGLEVEVALDRVRGFARQDLRDFRLDYTAQRGRNLSLTASAATTAGKSASLKVSGTQRRSVALSTADAGALLSFAGIYDHMEGGRAQLRLASSRRGEYAGNLTVTDLSLVNEPRLSGLVASSPAPRNGADRSGGMETIEQAFFDIAQAGIRYGADGLRVEDGIIRGPAFGSSFEGTVHDARDRMDISGSFMPAYGINRMFGAIPLVGQILGNGREGGLIGITYRLAGPVAAPTLTVNPLSAIAPGIFRRIFAY